MKEETNKVVADLCGVVRLTRNRYMKISPALLELIDNCIDAEATVISISERERDLYIEDNGRGFDDICAALVIGKSSKNDAIGRYGVGLKDACIRFSNQTRIISRGVWVEIPWLAISTGDCDGSYLQGAAVNDGTTKIILEDFRDRYKSTQGLPTKDIRRVYSQILKAGSVSITVNGAALPPLEEPAYTDSIDECFMYEGKCVRLRGGIFKTDDPARPDWSGYNAYYKGRLIGPGRITDMGTGNTSCGNFCFILDLDDSGDKWTLTTNKDHVEELADLIAHCYHRYTHDMLEKADKESEEVELKSIEDEITAALNGVDTGNITRKPKQPRAKPLIEKPPKPGPQKSNTHTDTDEGPYVAIANGRKKHKPRMLFKFEHMAGDTFGTFSIREKFTLVTANKNNPFILENCKNIATLIPIMKFIYSAHITLKHIDVAQESLVNEILAKAGKQLA